METNRLVLRRWEDGDAADLYECARDPDVGPIAGWPAHASVEESLRVIRGVLRVPETYATCLKDTGRAIGSISLKFKGSTDLTERDDECELGYWIGKPYWGRGLMPEAVREVLRRAFEDLGMRCVWAGYYDGNDRSRRVQEKCGFRYHHTAENVPCQIDGLRRTEYVTCITRDEWSASRS